MGSCQSCLGQRDSSSYQNDEDTGLLYDDNGMQYGSFGEHLTGENDAVETQRENEAIQSVVAKTTSNMVDVFEIAPPPGGRASSTNFAYSGQGARLARYQHLVSKLNADDESLSASAKVGWLADDDTMEMQGNQAVTQNRNGDDAALVGTFADAAAAAAPSRATTTA